MKKVSKRNKKLIKNTVIFTIGNFATKCIAFFLVPLYTSVLMVSDYGNIDLMSTLCTMLVPLFTFNISESVLRYSLDKNIENNEILKIAKYILLFSFIPCCISYIVLLNFKAYSSYAIYVFIYLYTLICSQVFLCALKGQEKLKLYTFGGVLSAFLAVVFNILFLAILKLGIKGYFLAHILSSLVTFIFAYIFTNAYKVRIVGIDKKLMVQMVKYSSVLIPTSFMWWIMNSSDRIMVTSMISETANGIYAVSYKIPSLISTIIAIFNQAWLFSAIDEKDSKDKEIYTNKVFKLLFSFSFIIGIILLVVCKPFMKVYVSSDYYVAWKYMSFLIVGVIFQSLSTFISTSYSVQKDNKGFLFSGLVGAVVNIILNFILIPFIGVYGAAFATCVSYIVVFIYRVIDTKKYVYIHIFEKKYIISYFILLLAAISLYLDMYISFIVGFLLLMIICSLYFSEVKYILNMFLKKSKHKKLGR